MGIHGSVGGPRDPGMPPVDEKWRLVARGECTWNQNERCRVEVSRGVGKAGRGWKRVSPHNIVIDENQSKLNAFI